MDGKEVFVSTMDNKKDMRWDGTGHTDLLLAAVLMIIYYSLMDYVHSKNVQCKRHDMQYLTTHSS
jgi:hypothetical protein